MIDLERLEGLHVGSLSADELRVFNEACAEYRAYRSYTGIGALLGLATVKIVRAPQFERTDSDKT